MKTNMIPLRRNSDGRVTYSDNTATLYFEGASNMQAFITQKGRTESGDTVAQYRAEYPKEKILVLPFGEAMKRIHAAQDTKYIDAEWTEITEEQYDEALQCLPPEKWLRVRGVSIFRMMEYYTGNITGHYAACSGRYFTRRLRTTTKYETIADDIGAILAK